MNYQAGVIEFGLLVLIKILIQARKEIKSFLVQMSGLKERFLQKDLLRTSETTLVSTKVSLKLLTMSLQIIKPPNGLASN
jgi:hypothetical protein